MVGSAMTGNWSSRKKSMERAEGVRMGLMGRNRKDMGLMGLMGLMGIGIRGTGRIMGLMGIE